MMMRALFRGGPLDGTALSADRLPSEVRYPHKTRHSDDDWQHKYTLRGTPATGWYYEHIGHVGPPNEIYDCPKCGHPFEIERHDDD